MLLERSQLLTTTIILIWLSSVKTVSSSQLLKARWSMLNVSTYLWWMMVVLSWQAKITAYTSTDTFKFLHWGCNNCKLPSCNIVTSQVITNMVVYLALFWANFVSVCFQLVELISCDKLQPSYWLRQILQVCWTFWKLEERTVWQDYVN